MAAADALLPLVFVTGNKKKLEEVSTDLASMYEYRYNKFWVKMCQLSRIMPELQGEPLDIAREKCKLAAQAVKGPVITEDTSLCFNALNGLPGPYIKWFLEKTGHAGLNNLLAAYEDKSAYSQCVFAFSAGPDAEPILFDGRCPGRIVPARGPTNFGWDPVFQPDGFNETFAEMDKTVKNTISHRAKSLELLRRYFADHPDALRQTKRAK